MMSPSSVSVEPRMTPKSSRALSSRFSRCLRRTAPIRVESHMTAKDSAKTSRGKSTTLFIDRAYRPAMARPLTLLKASDSRSDGTKVQCPPNAPIAMLDHDRSQDLSPGLGAHMKDHLSTST